MMFRKKPKPEFDAAGMTPVIRASICTGERVAGFQDASGRFHELSLLRSEADLREFLETYGLEAAQVRTIY